MKTGIEFADCALLPKWDKYKYDQLDCQAFVEKVLVDIGVRKTDGQPFNWKGCNSMYRNYYSWRGSIDECIKQFGFIPIGAFVYIWKPTGEEERGYHDGLGNCTHVGIYCGNDIVRDSTRSTNPKRDGVGNRSLEGFNRVTLFKYLDYSVTNPYNPDVELIKAKIKALHNDLIDLEEIINGLFGSKGTT